MNIEAPEGIKRGEQVGIRCSVYNFWHEDLEVRSSFTLTVMHDDVR